MSSRSTITLQFGAYANYVGAHFWNFQDELASPACTDPSTGYCEVSASSLYKFSEDARGAPLVTPRLIIFDAAGSAGLMRAARGTPGYLASRSARRGGALGGADAFAASTLPRNAFLESLDEEGSGDADWRGEGDARAGEGGGGADGGRVDGSLASAASAVGEDIDFDTIVTSWGDYSKTTLSPRSLVGVGGRAPTGETYGPSGAAAGLRSGTANFDAFSDGSGLFNESCEDALRSQFESCDSLDGVQVVVDVDSGWGGFAVDALSSLRDDAPKCPLLVIGAAVPRSRLIESAAGVGGDTSGGVVRDWALRDRAHIRRVNLALAAAHFGGADNDLDAVYLPLSLQSLLEAQEDAAAAIASTSRTPVSALARSAATSWLPGLLQPRLSSSFESSAMLAAAWDCATLPFRRARAQTGVQGRITSDTRMVHDAMLGGGAQSARGERPTLSGGGGGASSSSGPPLVALPVDCCFSEWATSLRGDAQHLRVLSTSLALPFAAPYSTPAAFAELLRAMPAASCAPVDVLTPLSWATALPRSMYSRQPFAATQKIREVGLGGPRGSAPFAHVLTVRGVGGVGADVQALGRACDDWLARDGSRSAAHAVLRTPLPLPVTFPSLFRGKLFDANGARTRESIENRSTADSAPCARAMRSVCDISSGSRGLTTTAFAPGDGGGVSLPFALPVISHTANTPAFGPSLRAISEDFASHDRAINARFDSDISNAGGGARTGAGRGGGCGLMTFEECASVLSALCDGYNAADSD